MFELKFLSKYKEKVEDRFGSLMLVLVKVMSWLILWNLNIFDGIRFVIIVILFIFVNLLSLMVMLEL